MIAMRLECGETAQYRERGVMAKGGGMRVFEPLIDANELLISFASASSSVEYRLVFC
ncbi:MAG: hypothetical protein GXP24_09210 [Planctomycetes bacterium]|nr:hypothetical protein [Planctomycetota bacterium]